MRPRVCANRPGLSAKRREDKSGNIREAENLFLVVHYIQHSETQIKFNNKNVFRLSFINIISLFQLLDWKEPDFDRDFGQNKNREKNSVFVYSFKFNRFEFEGR